MIEEYQDILCVLGDEEEFNSLNTIRPDILYFSYDSDILRVGNSILNSNIHTVSSIPNSDVIGIEGHIYRLADKSSCYGYIGDRWIVIYDPTSYNMISVDRYKDIISYDMDSYEYLYPKYISFKYRGTVECRKHLISVDPTLGSIYLVLCNQCEYVYLKCGWVRLGHVYGYACSQFLDNDGHPVTSDYACKCPYKHDID